MLKRHTGINPNAGCVCTLGNGPATEGQTPACPDALCQRDPCAHFLMGLFHRAH